LNEDTLITKTIGHSNRGIGGSDDDRQDGADRWHQGPPDDAREFTAQTGGDLFEPLAGGVISSDTQDAFTDGVGERRADARGKNKTARSVPEPRAEGLRAGDEGALKADRFAKGADENIRLDVDRCGDASTCGSEGSDGVSFVDDEGGIVRVAEGAKFFQVGDIAISAARRYAIMAPLEIPAARIFLELME